MTMPPISETVTLREVYALVDGRTDKMLAEMRAIESKFDGYVDSHATKHDAEQWKRQSLIRWAVTTIISVGGIATAIILPLIQK